jgi:hypothetical protein
MESDAAPSAAKPKSRLRWYRFALCTLLIGVVVLGIPLCYVGWQARIVQERRVMLGEIRQAGGEAFPFASVGLFEDGLAPWCRSLLGDTGFGLIYLPKAMIGKTPKVEKLFPESSIYPLKSLTGARL